MEEEGKFEEESIEKMRIKGEKKGDKVKEGVVKKEKGWKEI